jgi:hypothetical protein
MAQVLIKRSAENIPMQFDCSLDLPAGVIITSVTSIAPDQVTVPPLVATGPTISTLPITYADTGTVAPAGTVVTAFFSGGTVTTPNTPYLVRMLYTASDGSSMEAIGYLGVVDNPPIGFLQA